MRLAFCLLPGTALAQLSAAPPRGAGPARPYLTWVAAPALRFAEAPPPPDLSVRPPAGPPPNLPALESISDPAQDIAPAITPPPPSPVPNDPDTRNDAKVPNPPPARIIPDDTRPAVRPEDFLPYFIFPGNAQGAGNPTVVLPGSLTPAAPGTQPLSTATYRLQ
jgi:hypothetical protein